MFFKKGALKSFAIFIGKHLGWILFLIKLFSCEYCKIFKKIFFYRTPLVAAPNTTKKAIWFDLLVTDAVNFSASAVS